MDKVIVVISGMLGIGFVVWFFFGKKEEKGEALSVKGKEQIDVIVSGGYNPPKIVIRKGVRTTINLLRKDSSSCLEEIVIPEFKIKKYLPLGKNVVIDIVPEKEGEFQFSCGMNMYHGTIIVKGKA